MKKLVRLTEHDLRNIVKQSVKRIIKEGFDDEFNKARNNYDRHGFGFEMKNQDDELGFGEITYNPNTKTMSCMGVEIEVDEDMTVDQNIGALYERLKERGYYDE